MSVAGYEATPRYAELIRRVLGEDTEFVPQGFELEGADDRLDWLLHKREFLAICYSGIIAAGGAGNAGGYSLANATPVPPAAGGLIATIEGGFVKTVAGTLVTYRVDTAIIGGAATGNQQYRDGRVQPPWSTSRALAVGGRGVNALGGTPGGLALWNQQVTANVYTPMNLPPFVIPPGAALTVHDVTVNEAFEAAWVYRYRLARPEELVS